MIKQTASAVVVGLLALAVWTPASADMRVPNEEQSSPIPLEEHCCPASAPYRRVHDHTCYKTMHDCEGHDHQHHCEHGPCGR